MKYNPRKFNFIETFNNPNGKTSGSAFIGIIGSLFCMSIILTGVVIYIISLYSQPKNIILVMPIINNTVMSIVGLASLYAGLLGLRKWKSSITANSAEATLGDEEPEQKPEILSPPTDPNIIIDPNAPTIK